MPTFAQAFWSVSAVMTLGAGYFGSSVVGFLFVVSFAKKKPKKRHWEWLMGFWMGRGGDSFADVSR